MEMEVFKDLPTATVLAVTTAYAIQAQVDSTIVMVGIIGLVFVTLSKVLRNGECRI